MLGKSIGIDLGTSTVLIYVRGKGVVLREPSVVAMDKTTGRYLKVGYEAQEMLGRTPKNIVAIRPMKDGVISDFDTTEYMLRYFIRKVNGHSIFHPDVVICVPSKINEVEERAVRLAAANAGAGSIDLIEEPMAAALGSGIDISRPRGVMVVDVGGGTTDVAVISLNDIVLSDSVKCAGDKFDEAIIRYVRKAYGIVIGKRTAEDIKIRIGCLSPRPAPLTMTVRGRSVSTGLPREFIISSENVMSALSDCAAAITETVHDILSRTPPELISDISADGITLTGGGSLIYGMDKMLASKVGIQVHRDEDAAQCVAKGTGTAIDHIENMSDIKVNSPKKKLWTQY